MWPGLDQRDHAAGGSAALRDDGVRPVWALASPGVDRSAWDTAVW